MLLWSIFFLLVTSIDYYEATKDILGCSQMPCVDSAINTCSMKGEYWTFTNNESRSVCYCCRNERSARIAAEQGLFYGDRYRICETIYIDEVSCNTREVRDCNYRAVSHSGSYVGCFYCRPRCESDFNCRDLNRVCGFTRKIQPVRACTEPIYRHIPKQSSYNLYTDPDYLKWLMSYLPEQAQLDNKLGFKQEFEDRK